MATTIYTKPGCPYCAKALDDLNGRGVEYEEKDVTSGAGIEAEALKWSKGARKVPIIVTDGTVSVGFNGH